MTPVLTDDPEGAICQKLLMEEGAATFLSMA
jgi:hypothetical protein